MKSQHTVKPGSPLPPPPVIRWALYYPKRRYNNLSMYSTVAHARSAVTNGMSYNTEGAILYEWIDEQWVERQL